MASVNVLTSDIILGILHIFTADAHKSLSYWKHALPALAICRSWRRLAVRLVYSTVIIGDGPVIELSYLPADASSKDNIGARNQRTNVDLFLATGHIRYAKELVISQTPEVYPIQPLLFIKQVLCQDAYKWTGIRTLRISFCMTIYNYEMHAENGDEDKLLAAQLAHGVAEKLCNVDTLAIQTMLEDPILIKFIETLGRCYFSRLSEIWWMTPGFISSECSTTRLTKCMLRHANNEQELPLICPRQLRSMHLVPFTNKFSWQCFRLDKESGIVVFDNLERLVLDSRHYGIDVPDGAPRLLENEKKLETVFPELRQLLLRCITVTPEIVKPFVASPLKTVIFEGPLGSALQLRALKLGRLDALKVSTWFGFSVPDDEFYSDSNMLFQTTESAPVVKFCIDIEDKVISAADIYWPCLTHLDVCDKYIDDLALDLVPRVPNLVYLHVRAFRAGHCETDQCARRYFADLRLRYRQPSSSRITDVLLLFAADRPKIYDELAVGQFSRYLPNLRNIKID